MQRHRPAPPAIRALSPLRDFLRTESAGAILVAGAAAIALVWANSPWADSYERLWASRAGIEIAGHSLTLDLRHWLNDGLMTVFFLLVGLEIKRELTDGHLSDRRAAVVPVMAAIGGMVLPAAIYLAIAGGTAPRGWAIPMATDIALAVGVLAVAGSRLPAALRAFLLGLAIVDDIGAILVIALVYSTGLAPVWLIAAAALVAAVIGAQRLQVNSVLPYVVIGVALWLCLHEAGIHPTIGGVALGLLAPSVPRLNPDYVDADELLDLSSAEAARETTSIARSSVSVVEWIQHVVHPWSSFLIVPVFALANAGIEVSVDGLDEAVRSRLAWGIFAGLVAGKPIGILLAVRATARSGMGDVPDGTVVQRWGVAAAGGIGFTVALFITELALTDPGQQAIAKLAILAGSLVSAAIAALCLRYRPST